MISGLKYVNAGAVVGLCILIYNTQKKVWQLDMEEKQRRVEVQRKLPKIVRLKPGECTQRCQPPEEIEGNFSGREASNSILNA